MNENPSLPEDESVAPVAATETTAGDPAAAAPFADAAAGRLPATDPAESSPDNALEVEEDDEYALSDDEFETSGILEDKSTVSKVASEAYDEYADDFENSTSSPPKGVNASASQVDDYGDDDFEV